MSDTAPTPWHHRFEPRRVSPATWLALAVAMLGVDYLTGPYVQFPVAYAFPVGLAAWYNGLRWALPLALVMPWARFFYISLWDEPHALHLPLTNTLIRVAVLVALAVLTDRAARHTRELDREVHMLEAMLPICAHCKRIRTEGQEWEGLEQYFNARDGTRFSHSICPTCLRALYPAYVDD